LRGRLGELIVSQEIDPDAKDYLTWITKVPSINKMVIVCLIWIGCVGCRPIEPVPVMFDRSTPVPISPTKQISINGLPLHEIWRWSGLVGTISGTPVVTIEEDRIVINTRSSLGETRIVVIDAPTGATVWESSSPIQNFSSLDADREHVYVGALRSVFAYDLETGQRLWEGAKQDVDKRGGLNVYAEGQHLKVYDPSGNRLYILDSETGETTQEIDYPALYFANDNIFLVDGCSRNLRVTCLNAIEEIKSNLLWTHNFDGGIHLWPVFLGDSFFINSGGDIFAVDIQSGEIKWEFTPDTFVTELALGDNRLYTLRSDAAIVSFDPETGEQIGIIEITPEQDIEYKGGEVPYFPYYTVASSNRFVAAYYSNSQELIVFEKSEE
jgi:outer membrane protein assembly factor BamB